ncbi:MAG: DNA-directed RNA polymerase subunit K [archaeon]
MIELTKYEQTRLLSARAEQLSCGAPPLVKTSKDSTPYLLAKEEFNKGLIPLAVIRVINNKKTIITVD